jgi:hypothetical protein
VSIDTNATQSAQGKPKIHIGPSGEKALKLYEQEIATYMRELPRLLEENEEGRYALIKGDMILSTWDTQRDAIQAGREKFGLDPICVVKVEMRNIQRYALLMEQLRESPCRL